MLVVDIPPGTVILLFLQISNVKNLCPLNFHKFQGRGVFNCQPVFFYYFFFFSILFFFYFISNWAVYEVWWHTPNVRKNKVLGVVDNTFNEGLSAELSDSDVRVD